MNTADMQALVGTTVAGRYEIESVLGAGGMGVVFRARQITMNRAVAIKLLHTHFGSNPHAVGRFEREMQATSKIEHPNTIRVYDYGETENKQLFLAVEYLQGRTLAKVLLEDERPMPVERLLRIAIQIGKALTAAHAEGVVHRDLKPDNVMLLDQYGERDFVKVLDFGIARFVEADEDAQRLTAEGAVVGTPAYMSPEQATGAAPDFRTDLYSLGIMLFEMATGAVPFDAPTTVSLMVKHVQEPPPRPSDMVPGHVPPELERLILQCLEKDPRARPSSADEVGRRLEACLPHRAPGALAAETRKTPASKAAGKGGGEQRSGGPAAPRRSPLLWIILAIVVLGGGAAAAIVVLGSGSGTTPSGSDAAVAVSDASATEEATSAASADADGPEETAGEDATQVAHADAAGGTTAVAATDDAGATVTGDAAVEGETAAADEVVGDETAADPDAGAEPEVAEDVAPEVEVPKDPRADLAVVFMDADEPDTLNSCMTRGPPGLLEVLTKAGRLLAGGKPTEMRPSDQEAFDLLREYGDLITASPEGQLFLARATLRVVQTPGEALAPAMKAVALCDAWALTHHVLGNVYQARQELAKAKQSYLRARDRAPDFIAPLFNAVLIELAEKRPKEAAMLLDDILRRKPELASARLLRGQAYLMAGDPIAAVVDLEAATTHAPRDATAWMLLGQARQKTGELESSKVAYCKAKELGLEAAAAKCP
ncbi:MAG: protein kinase [Deltaproteobacteria bacterium]|nr:protein kinase [Deltaproteobacteria bacterium]